MATPAAQIRPRPFGRAISWPWFREFIRWEIAPYPGRLNTVVRMTVTATLAMIIVVTFSIPNAFLAAFFSILLARENLVATWRGGRTVVLGFVGASLYTLLGMILFRGYPITHFFWVIGSLYLVFFIIRTMTNYAVAVASSIPIGVTMALWDRAVPSEVQVEGTLWPILIVAIGAAVTFGIEALYRIFDRSDPLIASVDDLLLTVQQAAESIAGHRTPPKSILDKILQYNMIGTGRLRVTLLRQGLDPARRAQRSALISIAGRLIALAANLGSAVQPSDDDAARLRALSERLAVIRAELRKSGAVSVSPAALEGQPSSGFPTLQEMERVVALIGEIFERDEADNPAQNPPGRDWWRTLFLPDAFENPEYQRFALAGCLAASVCYILYNALDWPGIGTTAVLTCIVTALTTIGNSIQAQFLRLSGFVVGGLILGISAQILILPDIDTVFGFAIFFAAVTAFAAWFATSSPRLSYFGVQIALSFYFVNLQDAHVQTDLTIARDKVVGVLLAILAMGFVFDRFGTKSAALQLQTLLVRNIRMVAQLAVCPVARGRGIAASPISRLRSQINDNFAGLESQMDAARFEFGFRHRRERDVGECGRIEKVQPELRSIFLLELSLLSHRGRPEIYSELSPDQNQALDHFLKEFSDELTHFAAWFANEEGPPAGMNDDSLRLLEQAFANGSSPNSQAIADICKKMLSSLLMLNSEC
jgi:multidrug resistance protein MdtO